MKKLMLVLASAAVLTLLMSGAAMAQQKKTLAVVVKGLDNPFFTVLGNGCELWNKENPKSEYKCVYTGPASSAGHFSAGQRSECMLTWDACASACGSRRRSVGRPSSPP